MTLVITRQDAAGMADALDALFAESPFGIARLDRGGGIVACNAALARLLDNQPTTLRGQAFADVFAADDRDEVRARLAQLVTGVARRITLENLRLAGPDDAGARAVQLFATVIEGDGGLRGLLVHVLETTERHHLEMRLAQAEKLQALGQLAGSISHDFNNLIAVILGCCEALLMRTRPGAAGSDELGQIRGTALRARELVRQLLSFVRKQPPRPIPLRLDRAIDDLAPLLGRLLGPAIALEVAHAAPLPLVRMDPGRFDQVILNLAVNARDAMPDGGRLSLRTAAVSLPDVRPADGARAGGSYVQVEVTDTGCGVPPEIIGQIFAPFFTTKPAGEGTGLGLATVREVVRQSRGDVEVASEAGAGAVFRILLPAAEPAAPAKARAEAAPGPEHRADPRRAAATLLLVEDEAAVRRFAARALRGHGWTVREAADGESALSALAEDGFDLLLTDLNLPDIPGTAVIEQARNTRPDLPVIVTSGELSAGAGFDPAAGRLAVLPKPFTLAELVAQVQRLLDG